MPSDMSSSGKTVKAGFTKSDKMKNGQGNNRGFSYFVAFHRVVQILQEIELEHIQEGKLKYFNNIIRSSAKYSS